MREVELELSVGDVLRIGDYTVTVVDLDGAEVSFRVDDSPHAEASANSCWESRPR